MEQGSALCVMQNHPIPVQLTFSAGRERAPSTETSQTKLCWIPPGFESSFGYKPTRSRPLLGHKLSWEPMKHIEPELNFMLMGAPTPFRGHLDWLSCKLTHIRTYRECMKCLQNSQRNFGAVTVSLLSFHEYKMEGLPPYFFFRTKQSKDESLNNPIPLELSTEKWHLPQRISFCKD